MAGLRFPLPTASRVASRLPAHDSGSRWSSFSFHVGLFHPLLYAGLSRRFRSDPKSYRKLPHLLVDNNRRSYYIVIMKLPDFEWDDFKNVQNRKKHGVSFYEAQYAFADTQRVIIEDLDHGGDEDRFFCFGKVKGGVMTVRFTMREGIIRIIGAGYWRKGKKIYEKENHIH